MARLCTSTSWRKMRKPLPKSRKGDNGKLLILAGNEKYHGSAILALLAAVRFCDLVYFHSTLENKAIAKSFLRGIKSSTPCVICGKGGELARHMKTADAILVGPGIGRGKTAKLLVKRVVSSGKPCVLDADALHLITSRQLHKNCLLTPHAGEFSALFGMEGTASNVAKMAKKHNCTILKKGPSDFIASSTSFAENRTHNAGMTKGGTGDVLAGLCAAQLSAGNGPFDSACAAAYLNGYAGNLLFRRMRHHFDAHDLACSLGAAAAQIEK